MILPNRLHLAQFALCALSLAQTPPDSSPATENSLTVSYGSQKVTPGIELKQTEVQTAPAINYPGSTARQPYVLLLVDLSIPAARVDASKLAPAQLPVAPGLGPNRTTRLHFYQAGLRFSPNGTLFNDTDPTAFYNGPSPPPGDIAHDYVFYLFKQEKGFRTPAADSPFNKTNVNANPSNRQSFNVQTFAEQTGVGDLAGANYFLVQNNQSASTSSSTASATQTVAASSPSAASFTGAATRISSEDAIGSIFVAAMAVFLAGA